MKQIAVIGAGGHTRSSINLLQQAYPDLNIKIYDDSYKLGSNEHIGLYEVSGTINDILEEDAIFLSVGNNTKRQGYFNQFKERIIKENLTHVSAFLEDNIDLGVSNQIFANAYINSFVQIINNNIINTYAILEHEVRVGSHNHISVGAKLCGRVRIGDRCMIGAGAIIIDSISICDDVIIGAGAVVTKDIIKPGTYVGVPAKIIK